MVYFANAIMFAFIASFWSKDGWINILIVLVLATLAMLNVVGAVPAVYKFIEF